MATTTGYMDFDDLKNRVTGIRDVLKRYKVTLVPGEGLEAALAEAEAVADAVKAGKKGTEQAFIDSARAVSVVWNLSETLAPCLAHGLDLGQHLRQMTTGSVDYGVPAPAGQQKRIFYKDFEYELFTAAHCLNKGMKVALNPVSNDPSGDLFIEPLRVEIKHPNSTKQLVKLAKKFNKKLVEAGRFGVFVVGLEDAFKLDPGRMFKDDAEWRAWLGPKEEEVETFGVSFLPVAANLSRILVTVQTWTVWYQVGGGVSLKRFGNAMMFDERADAADEHYRAADAVLGAYRPTLQRWSAVKDRVTAKAAALPAVDDDAPEAGEGGAAPAPATK